MNKSEKSDHPPQQEPWCFVEVVNKVSVRDKTSSPQHSRYSYGSGALIRSDFHPETAEKIAPHCMARLDLANCISLMTRRGGSGDETGQECRGREAVGLPCHSL